MKSIYVNGCFFGVGTMQDVADMMLEYMYFDRHPRAEVVSPGRVEIEVI